LLSSYAQSEYRFEIVDVLQDPQIAELNRILATPALVKEDPLPLRILVGDLSDAEIVRSTLNLYESSGVKDD